jgi:hypothetical protein
MIRLHLQIGCGAPGPGPEMRVLEGGNGMTEVEPAPAGRKKRITLWPSIVMLALLFGFWMFLYNDILWPLFVFGLNLFSAVCLVCFLCQVVLRRLKKSPFFLIPVLLIATTGLLLFPWVPAVTRPVERSLYHSRDHAEFFIYNLRHHIKAEARKNGYRYKRWTLEKFSGTSYQIIYDAADMTVDEDDTESGGCYTSVLSLGDHFYFHRGECPGLLNLFNLLIFGLFRTR